MTKKDLLEVIDRMIGVDIYDEVFKVLCQNLHITNAVKIGMGSNGIAYKYDNKILKITKDETEAEMKNKLIGQNVKHLPKIYKVYKISIESLRKYGYKADDNIFVIIQEYANPLTQQWLYFLNILMDVLNEDEEHDDWTEGIYLQSVADYIKNFKYIKEGVERKMKFSSDYYNNLFDLFREMYRYKIDTTDVTYQNFGLGESGNLIFFDIGYGSGGIVVNNEIII